MVRFIFQSLLSVDNGEDSIASFDDDDLSSKNPSRAMIYGAFSLPARRRTPAPACPVLGGTALYSRLVPRRELTEKKEEGGRKSRGGRLTKDVYIFGALWIRPLLPSPSSACPPPLAQTRVSFSAVCCHVDTNPMYTSEMMTH
jgi:hypothetical protein